MKNKFFLLLSVVTFILAFCTSCNAETQEISSDTPSEEIVETTPTEPVINNEPTEEPSEEIIPYEEIKDTMRIDYFNKFKNRFMHAKTSEELEVQFLGQFGNSIAIHVLEDKDHCLLNYELFSHTIEGYEFRFEDIRKVYIYNDGKFLSLEEALKDLITADDLAIIHAEFKSQNPEFYKNIVKDEFISIHSELSPETIAIKMQPNYNDKDYTAEDFSEISFVNFTDKGKKDNLSQIYARYEIDLAEGITMDEAVEICRVLEQRDDIYQIYFPYTTVN